MGTNLLNENKKAFQFLHVAEGFDFEKDYFISEGIGNFTFNSITKTIKENITGEYVAAVLVKPLQERSLHYVHMGRSEFQPLRKEGLSYWNYNVDYFFSKGNFEETRKKKTERFYIVAQKAEYLRTDEKLSFVDWSQRFRIAHIRVWPCGDGRGNTWITRLELSPFIGAGEKIEYNTNWTVIPKEKRLGDINDYIDKSGYLVIEKRRELAHRANALRAERNKAAAMAADYTEKETALLADIETAKKKLAAAVLEIQDESTAKNTEHALNTMYWLMREYSRYRTNQAEKRFSSVGEIENSIGRMKKYTDEIMEVQNNA